MKLPTLGLSVHMHHVPKCERGAEPFPAMHDPSCAGRGPEVTCNQVTIFGFRFATCVHHNA